MKTSHIIAMAIGSAAALGGIYLLNEKKKSTPATEKSDFLGFGRPTLGSQKWANIQAAKWCKLQKFILSFRPASSLSGGHGNIVAMDKVKLEAAFIMNQLVSYGYAVYRCKAVKKQQGRWQNGDRIGNDCYCNGAFGPDGCRKCAGSK